MIYTLPNGVQLDLSIEILNDWGSGFITRVNITNISGVPLDTWSLSLDLADGITVTRSSQMTPTQTDDVVTFSPSAPWLQTLSPGEVSNFTFQSSGSVNDLAMDIKPFVLTVDGTAYELTGDSSPTGGIQSELIIKKTWPTGAWLQIAITNFTDSGVSDWKLPIDLPEGVTFQSSGALDLITDGTGQSFLVPITAEFQTFPAGDTIAVGFVVQGDPSLMSQITLGDVTGAIPPSAVNDTITDYDFDTANGVLSIDVADILANDSSADGSSISLQDVYVVAGGGSAAIADGAIEYTMNPSETGRIVLGYTIADGAGLTNAGQVLVDLPTPPEFSVSDVTVNEDDGTAEFTITLTGPLSLNDQVYVDFATRDGTALAGIDFAAKSGTLQFTETERTKTVTVDLIDDNNAELVEHFSLLLSNAKGARIAGDAGTATIQDDAGDTQLLGFTTAGLDIDVTLAGQYVVGHSFNLAITNNTGAALVDNPLITLGVQDGMKLVTNTGGNYTPLGGSNLTQDSQAAIVASHDDRYFTLAIAPREEFNPALEDGTWDNGETVNVELFFRGSHFFKPLEERIEIDPAGLVADQPARPYTPLDLTYKGFNTTFFNRTQVTEENVKASFDEQVDMGANSVAIVTTHFMDDTTATEVRATDFTMTDEDLVTAIREAKADNMNVLLKPHIDLDSGQFRGQLLGAVGPQKIADFFGRQEDGSYAEGSYGELMMRYAGIAEAEGIDVMLVGTELVSLAKNRANLPHWEQLIDDIRGVYSGDLSYATIVGEELFVRFWDKLDYISLDIYPLLTDNEGPSVSELKDGWTELPTTARGLEAYFNQPIADLISEMSAQYGKKVLITETGFRSVDGIAARPFDFNLQGHADLQEQYDAYDAFFMAARESMGDFLDGVFLWEYSNQPTPADGTVEQAYGYTPQNKPVYDLISDFFDIA